MHQLAQLARLHRKQELTTGSLIPGAPGGRMSVITSYTASMYRGEQTLMHGSGRHVLINLVGMFPVQRALAPS